MIRQILRIVSVVMLLLTFLAIVMLWIRSYLTHDFLIWNTSTRCNILFVSRGHITGISYYGEFRKNEWLSIHSKTEAYYLLGREYLGHHLLDDATEKWGFGVVTTGREPADHFPKWGLPVPTPPVYDYIINVHHALPLLAACAAIPPLFLLVLSLYRIRRFHKRRIHALCTTCAYDLRAHLPGQKCPECGTPIPIPSK